MHKIATPPIRRTIVGRSVRLGQVRITTLLAPALQVIREPGKPPRVEFVAPDLMPWARAS